MNENKEFNPMQFVVAESKSGGLPEGNYVGVFLGAKYLPEQEADPMTGEGGRQWAKIAFKWEVTEGEHKGETAVRETPFSQGVKASYVAVCGLVMGKQLAAGTAVNLAPFVGRKYLLTVSVKVKKNGTPTTWTHVSNAMLMP